MFLPKDDKTYQWTSHIKNKMMYYRLSAQKIKNILKFYDRKEEGIAPKTQAVMKRNDTPKRKEEIWVMYSRHKVGTPTFLSKNKNSTSGQKTEETILISAWRYPGVSKKGSKIPVPDEILAEIQTWFNKK